jgi:hypothetical protein
MNDEIRHELAVLRAGKTPWHIIAEHMSKTRGIEKSAECWRKILNRKVDKRTPGGELVHEVRKNRSVVIPTDAGPKLIRLVKGVPKRLDALAGAMGMPEGMMVALIEELREKGHDIRTDNGMAWLDCRGSEGELERREEWDGRKQIRFLAVSDTHLCSKYQQLGYLNDAYTDAVNMGCDFAIHVGDLTDGFYQNRPGHIYELHKVGYDDQLDYVTAVYPKRTKPDGTTFITKMISGNHDQTHKLSDGANIVRAFARQRDDIQFLGDSFCKLWLTPNCDIDIQHPGDGSAYALSYAMQKSIDALMGGEKPKLMLLGHHHKAMYMSYRNIHAFEVPSLQAQTPWEKSKRIFAVVGWWIITIMVDRDGTVLRVTPEHHQRYEMRKDDY